jgi:hypothetical protein
MVLDINQAYRGVLVHYELVYLAVFGFNFLLDIFLKVKVPVGLIFAAIAIFS